MAILLHTGICTNVTSFRSDLDTKIREGLEDQFTSTKEAIEDTQRELASREE